MCVKEFNWREDILCLLSAKSAWSNLIFLDNPTYKHCARFWRTSTLFQRKLGQSWLIYLLQQSKACCWMLLFGKTVTLQPDGDILLMRQGVFSFLVLAHQCTCPCRGVKPFYVSIDPPISPSSPPSCNHFCVTNLWANTPVASPLPLALSSSFPNFCFSFTDVFHCFHWIEFSLQHKQVPIGYLYILSVIISLNQMCSFVGVGFPELAWKLKSCNCLKTHVLDFFSLHDRVADQLLFSQQDKLLVLLVDSHRKCSFDFRLFGHRLFLSSPGVGFYLSLLVWKMA